MQIKLHSIQLILARATKVLALVVAMLVNAFFVRAQVTSANIRVEFPFDSDEIVQDYLDNASAFSALSAMVEAGALQDGGSLEVISYSSPEGNWAYNLDLSRRRANALKSYLISTYPAFNVRVVIKAGAEAWEDLRNFVNNDRRISSELRKKVIDILDSSAEPDTMEKMLKALPEYKSLYSLFFKRLRYASIVLESDKLATAGFSGVKTATGATRLVPAMRRDVVLFPLVETSIYPRFMDNPSVLEGIDALLSSHSADEFESLTITSGSSVEGPVSINNRLSAARGETLRNYIVSRCPALASKITVVSEGEAWEDFRMMVEKDTEDYVPANVRSKVLDIIGSNNTPERKEALLKALPDYEAVAARYFPAIRFASLDVRFAPSAATEVVPVLPEIDTTVTEEPDTTSYAPVMDTLSTDIAKADTLSKKEENKGVAIPVLETEPVEKPIIAVGTNMLYDLAITPNFNVEVPIGKHWSAYAEYTFPWWVNAGNNRAWQMLKWDLGGRYWFNADNRDVTTALKGHFVGLDLSAGYYDIEPYHKGYQGEFQLIGLEYGYSWKLNDHWRIDAAAGLGWIGTHYRYYEGSDDDVHLLYRYSGKANFLFYPVKAEIGIKYLFTNKSWRKSR